MTKQWYIRVKGQTEGPYDPLELKRHREVTFDTLVWKQGFDSWKPLKEVKELRDFLNEEDQPRKKEVIEPIKKKLPGEDEVLTIQFDPSHWFIWLFIILIILLYVMYKLGQY